MSVKKDTDEHKLTSLIAVQRALQTTSSSDADSKFSAYKEKISGPNVSLTDMRAAAKEVLGRDLGWDWDLPRTREGYYHYSGGMPVSASID